MDYLLGIDLGTTHLKVLLIDQTGRPVAQASCPYPTHSPHPGWSEQEPKVWWEKLCEILPQITRKISQTRIAGIALSGQMHGLVLVNSLGEPIRPCLTWIDQRATEESQQIQERLGWKTLQKTVGNRPMPDFTLPKLLWIQKHEPGIFQSGLKLLLPKGYLRYRLTGEYHMEVADGSSPLMVDIFKRNWAKEMLEDLGVPSSLLPPLCESTTIVGKISREAAQETGLTPGIPVVAGAGDQQAGALGGGIMEPGIVSATIGTGGQISTTVSTPLMEPGGKLHTFCHCIPNRWHLMGAMKTAGLALQWLQRNILDKRLSYKQIDEMAAQVSPGSDGLIFLPYLTGERTPHFDPHAKGVFFGLTLDHSSAHMARSVMEGVTYAMRDSLELFKSIEIPIKEIRLAGGGATSKVWSQIQTDIFEAPVLQTPAQDQSVYGAALLAGLGVGLYPSLESLPLYPSENEEKQTLSPIPKNQEVYYRLYPKFQMLYRSIKDLH